MIDFDKAEEQLNRFGGYEKKTTILYQGKRYMLKHPDPVREGKFKGALSYKNNQFWEHIGCQIFKSCGFEVQDILQKPSMLAQLEEYKRQIVECDAAKTAEDKTIKPRKEDADR